MISICDWAHTHQHETDGILNGYGLQLEAMPDAHPSNPGSGIGRDLSNPPMLFFYYPARYLHLQQGRGRVCLGEENTFYESAWSMSKGEGIGLAHV